MFSALRVLGSQGRQYIVDVRQAQLNGFRGRPVITQRPCAPDCNACVASCPTAAITQAPLALDLGRCVFCGECALACPEGKIGFTTDYRMASGRRDTLVVREAHAEPPAVDVSAALKKLFGRSLKMRSVSTGGCNACELELNALGNVNFDLGRYGIEFVASPRHADALVLSGPLTRNMGEALDLCYAGMPEPRFVISVGACAISGGLYDGSPALEREFLSRFTPSLYVPGCPPHPLTFVNGILDLLGIALPARG